LPRTRGGAGGARILNAAGVALLAAWLYQPILSHGLAGEDFELLRASGASSVGSLLAPREGPPFPGGNPYWRPLTSLVHKGVLALAGGDLLAAAPVGHAVSLALHAANAVLLALLAGALGLRAFPAAVAGMLFAASPGPVAAVAWYGAVNKPLTALFSLLAAGAALRFGERGGFKALVGTWAACAAALASSELAYPLVAVLPLAVASRSPARSRAPILLLSLGAAALLQLLVLQPRGALARGVGGGLSGDAIAANLLGYLSVLVGGPSRLGVLETLVFLVPIFAAVVLLAGRPGRFAGAWLLLAPFPTALTGVAPFHCYLAAAPAALLLGFAISRVVGYGSPWRAIGTLATWLSLVVVLVVWMGAVRDEVRRWGAHGEEVRSFAEAVREGAPDIGPEDAVRLVNVPLTFEGALLGLAGGGLPRIEHVNFATTPGVALLPPGFAFREIEGRRAITIVRDADGRSRVLEGDDPAEGRERLAGALVYYDAMEIRSGEEAERRLASGEIDPRRTVLVEGGAPLPRSDREAERAERVEGGPSGGMGLRVRFRARAAQDAVFVYVPLAEDAPLLWFRPDPHHALLEREEAVVFPLGEARVDGAAVEWMRANGLYRAVRLPPGEHEIEFVFTL